MVGTALEIQAAHHCQFWCDHQIRTACRAYCVPQGLDSGGRAPRSGPAYLTCFRESAASLVGRSGYLLHLLSPFLQSEACSEASDGSTSAGLGGFVRFPIRPETVLPTRLICLRACCSGGLVRMRWPRLPPGTVCPLPRGLAICSAASSTSRGTAAHLPR